MATTAEGITFGTPPADDSTRRPSSDWTAIVEALKARPGEWARVERASAITTARSRVSQIRRGKARGFESGVWDARLEEIPKEESDGKERAYLWVSCVHPDTPGDTDVTVAPEEGDVPF